MKRTHRIRRVGAAALLGIGMTAGVIGVTAGVAGATGTTAPYGTLSAKNPTTITHGTTVNQPIGTVVLTLNHTALKVAALGHSLKLVLQVSVATGSGSVDWKASQAPVPTSTGNVSVGSCANAEYQVGSVTTNGTDTTAIVCTAFAKTSTGTSAGATLTFSGLKVTSTAATGKVKVAAILVTDTTTTATNDSVVTGAFTPATATVATYTVAAKVPSSITMAKTTTRTTVNVPPLAVGKASQNGATVSLTVNGTSTSYGWTSGAYIRLPVVYKPAGTATNCSGTKYVFYSSTPTVTVSGVTHTSTTPTISASLSSETSAPATTCGALEENLLKLSFTNSGTIGTSSTSGSFKITVSGIKLTVGSGFASATAPSTVEFLTSDFVGKNTTGTTTITSPVVDGKISKAYVTANTPAVTMAAGAYDQPISDVNVVESVAGSIPTNKYVCVTLTDTANGTTSLTTTANVFNSTSKPAVKVSSGNATVASTVTLENSTKTAVFQVTKASSATSPSTFQVSGLAVNAGTHTGLQPEVEVHYATTAAGCETTGTALTTTAAVAFATGVSSARIAGFTADATAAKLLETTFPTTSNTANTTPTKKDCLGYTDLATSAAVRPVILATTAHFQDALSSQYLAGQLHTGDLLTPTNSLSSVTLQALKYEGVTQVDIIGGTYVVSQTVVNELKTTPAYTCGGTSVLTTSGKTKYITVTRIAGFTATDTAMKVATSLPGARVGTVAAVTAYVGVNSTKGNGAYNDTPGSASTLPATASSVRTAILASSAEFQDAMAASVLSYAKWSGSQFRLRIV